MSHCHTGMKRLHLQCSPDLPPKVEVAIIGGGIIGTAICYWLARAGIPALMLERTSLAHGATRRNGGLVTIGPAESLSGATARLDGSILLGGCRAAAPAGDVGILVNQPTPEVQTALAQVFPRLFPALNGLKVTHRWAGRMAFTPDYNPHHRPGARYSRCLGCWRLLWARNGLWNDRRPIIS